MLARAHSIPMANITGAEAVDSGSKSAQINIKSKDGALSPSDAKAHSMQCISDALYEHCAAQPASTVFTQDDLMRTALIPNGDIGILLNVTTALTNSGHFRLMQRSGAPCWRCATAASTSALAELDKETAVVYSHIESAGREGVWSNQLTKRTGLHKVVMDKAIKVMEQKHLIKTVSNYRHPNRRTYMLWGLQPLEDVTGGPFFADGELDEEFVRVLCYEIERWVTARSWWFPKTVEEQRRGKKRKRKSELPTTKVGAEALRDSTLMSAATMNADSSNSQKLARPYPSGYSRYPSLSEVTNALNDTRIANTKLNLADIQLLVDILVWDGILEKLQRRDSEGRPKFVYRSVRSSVGEENMSSESGAAHKIPLTQAPCGRCPVFEVCEEGGLVNPRTCPYLHDWLYF